MHYSDNKWKDLGTSRELLQPPILVNVEDSVVGWRMVSPVYAEACLSFILSLRSCPIRLIKYEAVDTVYKTASRAL